MNLENRAKFWINVYEYHREELTGPIALAYAEDSASQSDDEIAAEWREWRRANRRAPMPADLNGDQTKADQVAVNIWSALTWLNWPMRKDNLGHEMIDEAFVYKSAGPVSTAVMLESGGFHKMKRKMHEYNEPFIKKDWRAAALRIMAQARAGKITLALPDPVKDNKILEEVKIKSLPERGGPRPYFGEDD